HKLDGVTFATVVYDEFSDIQTIDYPAGIQLSSITRDSLGRENGNTYTLASGQTLSDQIERYVSGDIKQGVELGIQKSYTYDNAGRLTSARLGDNTFSYEFGTPHESCTALPGSNPHTAKSGNRTKLTMNGKAITFCYDHADRLVSASDPSLTSVQYDSHGNTISLGDAAHTTEFTYDAADRNIAIRSDNKQTRYVRDAQDRILSRTHTQAGTPDTTTHYGFTGSGDTPDFTYDAAGNLTQKYLTLPGDVLVTITPNTQSAGATTFSLPNIHGDIFATINADGSLINTFMTGPFGEALPNQTNPTNTTLGTTYHYVGQHQKMTDLESSAIMGGITQMGARVYLPILGRFLQVDPVEGGGDNTYVYVNDPVNEDDLDGKVAPLAGIVLWHLGRIAVQQTVRVAAKHAAKHAVKHVAKKTVTHSTKKITQTTAKKVTVRRIRGYTRHGLNQAISRNNHGVSVRAIHNAVYRPVRIAYQSGGRVKYIGKDAVVILNKQGRIITTWAKNRRGRRY
ncbi:MAG: RHS repeat-associated core domain-containing protein, partial [Candidatus Saccharibacteria bacterium]|nr:RHS repeat-associated core domain-containing protein [Candidatus Saccharibacteria bacterium]